MSDDNTFRNRVYALIAVMLLNLAVIQFQLRQLATEPAKWPDCNQAIRTTSIPVQLIVGTETLTITSSLAVCQPR